MAMELIDLHIKKGDYPYSHVNVYQRAGKLARFTGLTMVSGRCEMISLYIYIHI